MVEPEYLLVHVGRQVVMGRPNVRALESPPEAVEEVLKAVRVAAPIDVPLGVVDAEQARVMRALARCEAPGAAARA